MSRGVWLIIAGVLLLGHTPAPAKPSLVIVKRGGVYYISNRIQPQANQADRHTPSLRWLPYNSQARPTFPGAKGSISKTDQPHDLRPGVIKAVSRMDSKPNVKAASAKGVPALSQLRLKKTHDVQVGNASDSPGNMGTAPRYLGWLWGKTGYRAPLALAAYHPGSQRPDLQQNLPPVQEIQALVRNVCKNFLTYAPAVPPGPDLLGDSNPLSYCFPVAPPYSFRDTWGDWRSGGRFHHAVDIVACDGTPVFAITSGVIHTLATWPSAGISLFLRGQDSRVYGFMHLQGYAPGIVEGKTVQKGELIAYVGHTGIKWDGAHLHLQVYADGSLDRDKLVNPYGLLVQLSNGKGVTDWSSPTMARRQIPAAEVVNFGPVTLSGSVPRKYQASPHKIIDASTWLPNNY
ncbi:MAG: M23 family metallopeptidase [Deltaproteobacteria bacterium]|nr:M23 family metallopeptidase [Deltaproteobacteria bacterium]